MLYLASMLHHTCHNCLLFCFFLFPNAPMLQQILILSFCFAGRAKPWHRQPVARRTCNRPGKDPPWRALVDEGFKRGISWSSACCDCGILSVIPKILRDKLSKIHPPIPTCLRAGVNIIALLRFSTLKHPGWKAMTMTNHKCVETPPPQETNWLASAYCESESRMCYKRNNGKEKNWRVVCSTDCNGLPDLCHASFLMSTYCSSVLVRKQKKYTYQCFGLANFSF